VEILSGSHFPSMPLFAGLHWYIFGQTVQGNFSPNHAVNIIL